MISPYSARFSVILSVLLSSVFCSTLLSQEVTLQFVSFPKSVAPEPVELLLGEGKKIEVKIPSNSLSEPYKVSALKTWAVGKLETGENGKTVFNTYGQAPALSSKNQLIILVRNGPTNAEGMEVIPVDFQLDSFGGGKFLFVNTTKVDIAGEVGERKFVIKPSMRELVLPESADGAKTFHALFYFRKGDEAQPFFSSKWPINDKARSLIFFYHDPNSQRIRFHSVRTFMK